MMTAAQVARVLYDDDMSRADEVPVERDGATAIAGWMRSAGEAGDTDTVDDIRAAGESAVAAAWDAIIAEASR